MSEKERQQKPRTSRTREWNEDHLDRIYITVPKGLKSRIEAHARSKDESVNGMIGRLLRAEMGLSEDEWKTGKSEDS